MAAPNYNFQKRQRELAKKKKQDEKRKRKQEKHETHAGDTAASDTGVPEKPA